MQSELSKVLERWGKAVREREAKKAERERRRPKPRRDPYVRTPEEIERYKALEERRFPD